MDRKLHYKKFVYKKVKKKNQAKHYDLILIFLKIYKLKKILD